MRRLAPLLVALLLAGAAAAQTAPDPADERALIAAANGLDVAVDAKDWAEARAHFADTITVRVGGAEAQPNEMAADDLIAVWQRNLFPGKTSFHLRGNHLVTVDGERASMTSHGYAWNRLPDLPGGDLWEVWGVYEYAFERQNGRWLITSFTFRPVHERGNPAVPTAPAPNAPAAPGPNDG